MRRDPSIHSPSGSPAPDRSAWPNRSNPPSPLFVTFTHSTHFPSIPLMSSHPARPLTRTEPRSPCWFVSSATWPPRAPLDPAAVALVPPTRFPPCPTTLALPRSRCDVVLTSLCLRVVRQSLPSGHLRARAHLPPSPAPILAARSTDPPAFLPRLYPLLAARTISH